VIFGSNLTSASIGFHRNGIKKTQPVTSMTMQPDSAPALDSQSYFSTLEFVTAVASVSGAGCSAHSVPVRSSGPARTMYALASRRRFGTRSLALAPYGLWASPGWSAGLEDATVVELLSRIQGPRTRDFTWNVRFDHTQLAEKLSAAGLNARRDPTRVLHLTGDHDATFRQYNTTIRNQVRRSMKSGLKVRSASSSSDVRQYYQMHAALAASKAFRTHYPLELFQRLVGPGGSGHLFVAEYEGRIVAGGFFFWDGCSVVYWHGGADRNYNHIFPTCGLCDTVIRWAGENGARFFNFGASAGIDSLDTFKSFWGAKTEWNWSFEWRNPAWTSLSKAASLLRRRAAVAESARSRIGRSETVGDLPHPAALR
jgi:hypothetical protein